MDDDDEEKKKYLSTANSMLNTILRGLGITGAAMAMLKDVALRAYQQHQEEKINATDLALATTSISPPFHYKVRMIEQAIRKIKYAEKNQSDDLLTDLYFRFATGLGAAGLNMPAERLVLKTEAIQDALNTEFENWERLGRFMGWSRYSLDMPRPWEKEEGSTYTSERTRKTRATTTRKRPTRKRKTRARR